MSAWKNLKRKLRVLEGLSGKGKSLSGPAAVFGILVGQVLFFTGKEFVGFLLTVFSAGFGISNLPASLRNALTSFLPSSAPERGSLKEKGASVRSSFREPSMKPLQLGLILLGFGLAGYGQYSWATRQGTMGSWCLLAGVLLFLAGFWSWPQERLKQAPLSFRWEMAAFFSIMVLAAFLRVYRIDSIPSGLFIDQGFQGMSALRILHEGWRPFYVEEIFHAYALALYQLAGWFGIFGATDVTLRLFYVALSLAGFPFIYWTFRQLAGPRMALLTLFILAVMRWHINFSRNGFPTIQLPLYMFAALAFLLYGLKEGKRWSFVAAAFFFAGGFYTYQAFKIFPLLLVIYVAYEAVVNRQALRKRWKGILGFLVLAFVLSYPVFNDIVIKKNAGTREKELSIFTKVKAEHSWKPFFQVVSRTAVMFNRQGDANPRHNLQDHRMLDDVSGALFLLGVGYSLFRIGRRKYFYAVTGFLVMSLPCIFSIDAAHANRMLGTTPFLAFFIAVPLAAFWGRMRAWSGVRGEFLFGGILILPLCFMVWQNFNIYFNRQANTLGSWSDYSIVESSIGKQIAKRGDAFEYFVSPRYYNFYSLNFYGYSVQSHIHSLLLPETAVPLGIAPDRGLFFALEDGRTGVLEFLKTLYPKGQVVEFTNPAHQVFLQCFEVPKEVWAAAKGLTAKFSNEAAARQVPEFPKGLPNGPYHVVLTGSFFAPRSGSYRFTSGSGSADWEINGQAPEGSVSLLKGFHSIQVKWEAPPGQVSPDFKAVITGGPTIPLNSSSLTTLGIPKGLTAKYYSGLEQTGKPLLEQWESTPNFVNGNDFSVTSNSAVWEGTLRLPVSGPYQFFVTSSGKMRLLLDGKELLGPGKQGTTPAFFEAGSYRLKLSGDSLGGFGSLSLFWVKPGGVKEVIPTQAFK